MSRYDSLTLVQICPNAVQLDTSNTCPTTCPNIYLYILDSWTGYGQTGLDMGICPSVDLDSWTRLVN